MHERRSQLGRGAVCPFDMHFSGRFLSVFLILEKERLCSRYRSRERYSIV